MSFRARIVAPLATLALVFVIGIDGHAAEVRAFPGAEGAGALSRGGRGGQVLIVTTLDDYKRGEKPIAGSLRAAVETPGPRTIVFEVGGAIELKSSLRVSEPFVTIAGQTAPGDGICLKHFDLNVRDTHDVVIRHLRVRPGDVSRKELDGLSVYQSKDVVIDHCSVSWSIDETLSVTGEGCGNVSIQWCFITESLNNSVHSKVTHGYGSLIRTDGDISFHHNLYAHHQTRCPRPGTYGQPRGILLDFRNNTIYDWISPAGYSAEDKASLNYVGNYLKPGPSTRDRKNIFKIGGAETRMFVADNKLEGREVDDPWLLIANAKSEHRANKPFEIAPIETDTPEVAYRRILDEAGATLPRRDAVDLRVVKQVREGTGRVIDSQADVGGWPKYETGKPLPDADRDGMADAWEAQHGLNPRDASDAHQDRDGDGYTNLEEFLNRIR